MAGSASSEAASSTLLFGSLVAVNVVFVGLFFVVRRVLRAFEPRSVVAVPTTVSRLAQTSADSPVPAISGTVAAGPDGPFTAPLSREECAWFRLQSFRPRQSIATDTVYWDKVSELASEGEVVIGDGTGSVHLSMTDVRDYGGWFLRSTSEPRRPVYGNAATRVGTALLGRTGLRQDEYVMPVGAAVTLIGHMVVVDGRVRPIPGRGGLVATPLTVQAWQAGQAALRARARRTSVITSTLCGMMAALVDVVLLWAVLASTG